MILAMLASPKSLFAALPQFLFILLIILADEADANPILIDSFDTPQGPIIVNSGSSNASNSVGGGGIIGGTRMVQLMHNAGPGNSIFQGDGNVGGYSEDTGTDGELIMTWDNAGAGLGGIDVTCGGMNDRIELSSRNDVGVMIELIITDTFTNSDNAVFVIPPAPTFQLFTIPLTAFTGLNFAQVDSIILNLDTDENPSTQIEIDYIEFRDPRIPEPGSLPIAGLGFVALAAVAWRHRQRA